MADPYNLPVLSGFPASIPDGMVRVIDDPDLVVDLPADAIEDMRRRARSIPPQLLQPDSNGVPTMLYGLHVAQRVMAELAGVKPRPENVNRQVVPTRRELRQAKKKKRQRKSRG